MLMLSSLLLLSGAAFGQLAPSPRQWSEQLQTSTLVVIYPTFKIKHERIRAAVASSPEDSRARRRAEEKIALEEAYRDTLLLALRQSFQEQYRITEVAFLADTSYRQWRRDSLPVRLIFPDGQLGSDRVLAKGSTLFLLRGSGDRQTGTGMEMWNLQTADQRVPPARFPVSFPDGSIGMRLLEFAEGMFRFKRLPETLAQTRVGTDYLAGQLQQKWQGYLSKLGW